MSNKPVADWAVLSLRGAGCAIGHGYDQDEIDAQIEILADWWREAAPFNPRRSHAQSAD